MNFGLQKPPTKLAVSCLLTDEVGLCSEVMFSEVCGGQSNFGTGLSTRISVLSCLYHSTNIKCSVLF